MKNTKSALLVGVGGQGAILTAKVLVNGLMKAGYDVKMSEVHGMSRRSLRFWGWTLSRSRSPFSQ